MEKECLLKKAEELEIESKDFGFRWDHIDQLMDQIQSECAEVKEAYEKGHKVHLQEEVGDLIHAAVSLAVFCDLDPRETFEESIVKYEKRFRKVIELAQKDGHATLKGHSFDRLMDYWKKAKKSLVH